MRLFTFIATALLLTFYSAARQKLTTQTRPKINEIKNTIAIKGRCAVIVKPDNKKIKLLKKGISDDEYMTLVSDNQYYLGTSVGFLDSVKVRQIEKKSIGVLNFRSLSGRYFKVSLDSCAWRIILFNGRTKPISADVTDIITSYRAYIKK